MKKTNLKLLRDALSARGIFLGVALVIFLGVAFYGAAYMAFQNLKSSYDYSYQTLRFADFTISVSGAPANTISELESIDGVTAVTGRINTDLPLTIPQGGKTAVLARVITLPAPDRPAVNDVKVENGVYFQNEQEQALLVEKSFAEHHKLEPGDSLNLVINGQPVIFRVAGIASSPEYIFAAKSRQELLVSPEVFGVVFAPQEILQQLTGINTLNEFCFTVAENSNRQTAINTAESILEPYSIQSVVTREEQASNAALSLDLQEFGELAEIFPLLFLIIGGLATYILLARMVQNQRGYIGTMRALGYSHRQVLVHYLGFALLIGIIGAVAGTVAGYFLSGAVTRLYITILGLPYTIIKVHWMAIEEGFLLGVIPCLIAGFLPARTASKLSPAEAMRTPPPVKGGRSFLERLFPFASRLPLLWKMPLRNIFRNRNRSLSIIFGVAFGISLVLVSAAFIDSVDALLELQSKQIQRYDAELNFAEPQPVGLVDDVASWEGITEAQPVLQMPVQLQHADTVYNTILVGIKPNNDLYGLSSPVGKSLSVPDHGILLAESLKSELGVDIGDTISITAPAGNDTLTVADFVKQPMGGFVYVSLDESWTLAGSQDVINAIMVATSSSDPANVRSQAAQLLPGASVELTTETRQVVSQLFDLIKTIMWVMLLFGAALALAILFTLITLSIIERRREFASMRTIGETRWRIDTMLTIENIWLGILGVIPGLLLGYGLAVYFFSIFQTDIVSFAMVVQGRTYALIIGLIILIVLVAQIPGIRNINHLDLARVTKEQAN
jgi:putative ABC transport system permease protein